MTALPKKRLGRGLAALIGDDLTDDVPATQNPEIRSALREVPIETVHSNNLNPRKHFNEEELQDLARSISEKGILQPVVVRPTGDGETFQIVAGERRWRAAQKAGLHTIPVLVRELSDKEVLEIAIIENVQRADLNPVEEAMGYQQLIDSFDYTQQQLAESIGKSRSHIANTLRLMTLPPAVLERLQRGDLTAGHARALIATDDPVGLSQKIVALGLSVRQAEALARNKSQPTEDTPSETESNCDLRSMEKSISEALGLRVSVQSTNGEKGKLIIIFKTLDQFEELCNKLGANH
ncbi:MAG: ParB/RepB/Spo0J family partition protein [Anderseniella sp.]|jgi:ParB family chromosome partitioning protein|nr:ParB/RepB/Spo0J family partition protein [Anderseniella sp.]